MAAGAARHLAGEIAEARKPGKHAMRLAIAVDARRGEVYVQHFESGGQDPLTAPMLLPVSEAAALGGDVPLVLAGSAAAAVAQAALRRGRKAAAYLADLMPDARDLALLAAAMAPAEEAITPLYMRPADAKPQTGKTIERGNNMSTAVTRLDPNS